MAEGEFPFQKELCQKLVTNCDNNVSFEYINGSITLTDNNFERPIRTYAKCGTGYLVARTFNQLTAALPSS